MRNEWGLSNLGQFDSVNQMSPLIVIPLSGAHCIQLMFSVFMGLKVIPLSGPYSITLITEEQNTLGRLFDQSFLSPNLFC